MKKFDKILKSGILFLSFVLLFFILNNASINNILYPFSFGMLFALTWANQKVYLLAPAYLISGLVLDFSLDNAISILVTIFMLVVPYYIHILCKKVMKKWEFGLFSLLSQTATLAFAIVYESSVVLSAVNVILGVLYMYSAIIIFEALIVRGFTNKLTSIELVSLFIIVMSLCAGLVNISIGGFSFLKLFVSLILFIFAFTSSSVLTLLMAITAGVGALLATNNPIYMTPFVIWALCALVFKNHHKVFMVIGVLCSEVIIGLYFKLYPAFNIIEALPVLLSACIFFILPNKWLNEFAVIFNLSKDRLAMKNVVNRNRELLCKRLSNLAEVFNDMNIIYRNMIKKGMSKEDVKKILYEELCDKICSYCPERNHCHRTFADSTKKVFEELITIAFERGKATLLDIPSYLTSRCKQTTAILGSVNTLTAQYKKYLTMASDVDSSKLMIAEQLLGISKVIDALSKEVDSNISFDTVRENKILDELTYHNIICIDAVVFEKDIHTLVASLVVRKEDAEKLRIVDCVGKVCGQKMAVFEMFPSVRPNYTVINLKTAPRFDCMFGVSQRAKANSSVSGDNYSVIKLDGDRILFAISDGMGSGEKAENYSELSIALIENFYKAGFDNDIIISSVNKLLNLHKDDIFSALDIGVLDLKNGICDFIKMASPVTFIVNTEEVKKVESTSLPLGIVDDAYPLIKKEVVSSGDYIILVSDGISDSFENDEAFKEEILSLRAKNPQELADQLLERALSKNKGYAIDDMTVLAIKIFKN
ncbi:MAG TPA: SpoIIE family protein phosphatase [Candidatus Caccovivens faecavium]|nr:SpoIIE family protein phosphatase [Candidatus Caccovivens faecavium]